MRITGVFAALTALPLLLPQALAVGVIPSGEVVGLSLAADGVVIAEVTEVVTEEGVFAPAKEAGLLAGDVIVAVDGGAVNGASELTAAIRNTEGALTLTYLRAGEERKTAVTPVRRDGMAVIGILARDGVTGLGTVTFYDPATGVYGALGHPVSDTGEAYADGSVHPAVITGIVPGKAGEPGELTGAVALEEETGSILLSSRLGVYGTLSEPPEGEVTETAAKREIRVGPATILAAVDGVPAPYDCEIIRVYPDSTDGRSLMLKVTDPELVRLTGGIVQGMSGSPILQNGRLVGAVTHVLLSDPKKGYGAAIEDMLREAEAVPLRENAA